MNLNLFFKILIVRSKVTTNLLLYISYEMKIVIGCLSHEMKIWLVRWSDFTRHWLLAKVMKTFALIMLYFAKKSFSLIKSLKAMRQGMDCGWKLSYSSECIVHFFKALWSITKKYRNKMQKRFIGKI